MEYKASFDPLSKGITSIIVVFLLITGWLFVQQLLGALGGDSGSWLHVGGLALLIGVLLITYSVSPRKYILTRNRFIIKRALFDRLIFVKDIEQARFLQPEEMKGTIRTFGSGGFFGYFGKFYNTHLGNFTAYMTQRKNRVLIRLHSGENIVITPDDMFFLKDIQKQLQPRPQLID